MIIVVLGLSLFLGAIMVSLSQDPDAAILGYYVPKTSRAKILLAIAALIVGMAMCGGYWWPVGII